MKCEKCGVTLTGAYAKCPLCKGHLQETPDKKERIFPAIPLSPQPGRLFISILAFITVAGAVICVAINLAVPTDRFWALFVLAGLASFWVSFILYLRKRGNILKVIIWQVVLISIVALVWDKFTGWHNWSLNYVLPSLSTCAMGLMAAIARLKKMQLTDYIIYIIIDSIFGIASLILILTKTVSVIYPSAICFAGSIISLAALLIFHGKTTRSEIHRRIHI